jgi:DNA polymerase I-like protein with 3'-5' exonuclease and polymerase domains
MRYLIGVDPGWPQLGYDFNAIELQILAIEAQDQLLLDAITKALHHDQECADWRARYDWQGEDDPRRKFSKIFVFRTAYGGSPKAAWKIPGAAKLGMSRNAIEQSCYRWLGAHPGLNQVWLKWGGGAMNNYLVRNSAGRRRVLCAPGEDARFRAGINHPVQSLVSDVVNITCNETMEDGDGDIRLYGQMHDSLTFAIIEPRFKDLCARALKIANTPRTFGGKEYPFSLTAYTRTIEAGKVVVRDL